MYFFCIVNTFFPLSISYINHHRLSEWIKKFAAKNDGEIIYFFFIFHEFFTEFIFIFRVAYVCRTYFFCLQSYLWGGKSKSISLYHSNKHKRWLFLQSLISKKKYVLFIGEDRKQKKSLEGEIFKSFFRDTFSQILSDSNSMYVYVLTTCSMIFLNVKTEHSKIILR